MPLELNVPTRGWLLLRACELSSHVFPEEHLLREAVLIS